MKLSPVIQQLRAAAPSLANRVAGAAEFDEAFEAEDTLAVPHAFVVPGLDSAEESLSAGRVDQRLDEGVTVVLCLDNTTDAHGQAASEQLDTLKTEIFGALLGFVPSPNDQGFGGLHYVSGFLIASSRARLWYGLDFNDFRIIGE